jgi:RNA polymerase sigma-70 factor (ECF subfamily)
MAAFGELVRRNQGSALRVAAVISGSTEEAKDIVQDALVKVHSRLDSYSGIGSVRSWVLRVVANEAKNHVRGRVRRIRRDDHHSRLSFRVVEGVDDVVERRLEHEALAESLAEALARLPSADREVLGCRFVAGLSELETAEVLEVAQGTVKSRTSRALGRLQHAFDSVESAEGRSD